MKRLEIEDNTSYSSLRFNDIPNIVDRVLDKTLLELENTGIFIFPDNLKKENSILEEQTILQSKYETYYSKNIMGFLGYGDENLIIKSRFSDKEDKKDYFFQYLLENVLKMPHVIDLSTLLDKEDNIINLLIFLFPYYLKKAMRKGLFKQYTRNKYNDDNLRGTIDIPRHIKLNIPFVGNIAYNQREFSYDNYITQLIRHTIEFIQTKKIGMNLLGSVKRESEMIREATSCYNRLDKNKIIMRNEKRPLRHAFYKEYRELQRLCLMILQQKKHYVGDGIKKIHGILFDGAWLWEEYIATLIGEDYYHPQNKEKYGVQNLFTNEDGRKLGKIYPDFISRNKRFRIIGDAKYKPITNIANRDYLQVLAYMFRFNSNMGYYFYPDSTHVQKQILFLNEGLSYEKSERKCENVSLIKLGLNIPKNNKSYEDFTKKMKQAEQIFLSELN